MRVLNDEPARSSEQHTAATRDRSSPPRAREPLRRLAPSMWNMLSMRPVVITVVADAPADAADEERLQPQATCAVQVLTRQTLRLPDDDDSRLFLHGIDDLIETDKSREAALRQIVAAGIELPDTASLATLDDIKALLEVERARDLLSCDDTTCYTEIAQALGADYIISGSLALLAGEYFLNLRAIPPDDPSAGGTVRMVYNNRACTREVLDKAAQELFTLMPSQLATQNH